MPLPRRADVNRRADAFRARRAALGISQQVLADRAGVSVSYIKLLESDKATTRPSKPFLRVLAEALECDVDDLLAEQPDAA